MDNDKIRYLIVTTGRSGSSLLSAILADAGAFFNMPNISSWDRIKGAYEHPKLHSAFKWYSRSQKIVKSVLPSQPWKRLFEIRIQRDLSDLFSDTIFAKSTGLIWLVQRIHKLGYQPKIIVSYRKFEGYATSRYLRFGWSVPEAVKVYSGVNSTALLQLQIFGGCAVSYEELTNTEDQSWAEAISTVTGLNCSRLLQSREKHSIPILRNSTLPIFDEAANDIYTKLLKLKGTVINPQHMT
ncbi:MAG: hypothetical protein IH875_11555 [Candidatus Dadabacteria bacterium]|nr:hypothetical protein [Candidatus Dadabacteria bacterium]